MSRLRVGWKAAKPDRSIASFRLRVESPIAALRERGHDVELLQPKSSDGYDVVVFSKSYSPADEDLAARLSARGCKVVFDLCDNHFYNPKAAPAYVSGAKRLRGMLQRADDIVCSSASLAEVIVNEVAAVPPPHVIGDIVERLIMPEPAPPSEARPALELLWYGSHGSPNAPGGIEDLALIAPALDQLRREGPTRLTVLSNSREAFDAVAPSLRVKTDYRDWSMEVFASALQKAHAVILPIAMNPFTCCKTNNRLALALYAGRPALATGIPSYQALSAFCTLDDWDEGFRRLKDDYPGEVQRAITAREPIDQTWSPSALAAEWEMALGLEPSWVGKARKPVAAARPSTYQGQLDAVAAGAVTGWVRSLQPGAEALHVVLESDGEVIATTLADLPRDDLRGLSFGNFHCGFALALAGVDMTNPGALRVKVAGSDWLVGQDPILIVEGDHVEELAPSSRAEPTEALAPTIPSALEPMRAQNRLQADVRQIEGLLDQLRGVLSRTALGLAEQGASPSSGVIDRSSSLSPPLQSPDVVEPDGSAG